MNRAPISRRLLLPVAAAVLFVQIPQSPGEEVSHAGLKPARLISWREAKAHVGQYRCVEGQVVRTSNIGRICFLNFGGRGAFSVVIFNRSFDAFPAPPERLYRDKKIRVWGIIADYRGQPEIVVTHPVQIQIEGAPPAAPPAPPPTKIRIATFNAHNLFDGLDDPYVADEGRDGKPLATPKEALAALVKVIRNDVKADVLGLQEIECRGLLDKIVHESLHGLGYKHVVLVEGNDSRRTGRGIDVALLSRFPVGAVTSFQYLTFRDAIGIPRRFARDALRVEVFPRPDFKLVVYVLHLKSRYGGKASQLWRNAEAKQVRQLVDADLARRERVVVMGDFNDDRSSVTLKTLVGDIGARRMEPAPAKSARRADSTCFSQAYPPIRFDYLLLSRGLQQRLRPGSAQILDTAAARRASDHRPVVAEISLGVR